MASRSSRTDRFPDRIGFRSIEAKDAACCSTAVFLRGVSIHAEAPFHAGRVYSEADARTLLQWAGCALQLRAAAALSTTKS
jgi:beta-glucuronidase